ncbi:hypothetical protein [uncultured Phocaeicola sp.]|uniref:hypothetical protein n=1 Tax=uncultured Phocaeicola sp. TaxID=990718 RepID=UPI0025D6E103|nr:hypothetical protein [uncultured Phocaeicola sp.]
MRIDNVTFVDEQVKKLTKEKFIEKHFSVIWQDKKESDRKKVLSDVYDKICGKPDNQGKAAE